MGQPYVARYRGRDSDIGTDGYIMSSSCPSTALKSVGSLSGLACTFTVRYRI